MTEPHEPHEQDPAALEQQLREQIGTLGPNHASVVHAWALLRAARARPIPPMSITDLLNAAVPWDPPATLPSSPGAGDTRVMAIIERSLEIGDTLRARLDLNRWRGRVEASPAPGLGSRLTAAERRLEALLEFERQHGHACLLDRTAEEVLWTELEAKWDGRASPYGPRRPSCGVS